MGFFKKLLSSGETAPTVGNLAQQIRLEPNGDVCVYNESGYKLKQILPCCDRNNRELQIFDNKVYLLKNDRRVMVYTTEGKHLSSYFANSNPNASWVKNV